MANESAIPEQPFKRMADAAHALLPDAAGEAQDRQAIARLQASLVRRRRLTPWLLAAALCALAAPIVLLTTFKHAASITYTIDGQTGRNYVQALTAPTTLTFSDGTEVEFDREALGRVTETTAVGANVAIENGTAHVNVVKRLTTRWSFEAGPFSVQVHGTKFDITWSPASGDFEVRLLEGKVVVTGPLTGEGVNLESGHRLVAQVRKGWIRIDSDDAAGAPAAASSGAVASSAADPVAIVGAAAAPEAPAKTATDNSAPRLPWSKRVSAGESAAVLEEAERRGIARTLAEASSADVAALADAARYAGKIELSRRALLAERERFPGSAAARDAAFLLGRLAEDKGADGREAMRWYDVYLAETSSGLYASEALGRKMTSMRRLSGPDSARPVAQEYLRRFPTGPYASVARSLVSPP